jgi:hypothetical protein
MAHTLVLLDQLTRWPVDSAASVLDQLDPDEPIPFVVSPAAAVMLRTPPC